MQYNEYSWHCSRIPDGPQHVGLLLHGMRIIDDPGRSHFIDRLGHYIQIPRTDNGKPYCDDGYAKALWDLRNGSLLLGEDDRTLYVRDVDRTGANRLLDTWHAITSIENEYHVKAAKAYIPWNEQLRVEAAKFDGRVHHGIRFQDRAYRRESDGVHIIHPDDPMFTDPWELTCDQPFDDTLLRNASWFLHDVTVDDHSAQNLARMFATPELEPYKHLTFILYGDGGNGKGILLSMLAGSFLGLAASIDSQRILGGKRGGGGFDTQQEMGKLIGALWAYDEDADDVGLDQLTYLKKISTGDTVTARRIGENAVSFRPRCTFILATNNTVITTMSAASARRFTYIRMKDGRKPSDFKSLLDFRAEYGVAPFLMAGCEIWRLHGDDPFTDVSIGGTDDVTDVEQDIINSVCDDGYALSSQMADLKKWEQKALLARFGLYRAGSVWIASLGRTARALRVKDEVRFAPYRAAYESDREQLARQLEEDAPLPDPIDVDDVPLPTSVGFHADYVPAGPDKVARNWKRLTEDTAYDSTIRPDTDAYAVVPGMGMAIIDMDKPHADQPDQADGWTTLNTQVGRYGSDQFPATYLVGTPSGGVHAYYRLPERLVGRLKNSVHSNGIPVDVRCERKGYVIGAGSVTAKGEYRLIDLPDGDIPVMSDRMADWLESNGYVEGASAVVSQASRPASRPLPDLDDLMRDGIRLGDGSGRPDMSVIPEGQRNQTLHDWAYGRLANHPDNATGIRADLFARGHASGLGDAELTTIWNSVSRALGMREAA